MDTTDAKERIESCLEQLLEALNSFDDEEPMSSEGREIFRNELVPRLSSTLNKAVQVQDYDTLEELVLLWGSFHGLFRCCGPAWPHDELEQRADLEADEQQWNAQSLFGELLLALKFARGGKPD
jgi:hypothetical protein